MRSLVRQSGMGFLSWMVLIAVLGFGSVIGFRLVPIYLQAYTVDQILENVAVDSENKNWGKGQIWDSISKRLDINGIGDIQKGDFSFSREKGKTTIAINYEVRLKLVGNLDGVAQFASSKTFDT